MVGGLLALVPFLLLLMDHDATLLRREGILGGFYDVQARAWLHGRWDVPAASVWIEGIRHAGRTYMYFGPFPALLRLPVVALTHSFDRRLSQISMLLAFGVAVAAIVSLSVRVRALLRGDTPVSRIERWVLGATVFGLTGASTLSFLASQAIVYHEAALWGAALSLAAIERVVALAARPSWPRVVVAGGLATLAMSSRPSVGIAPAVTLGLLAVVAGSSRLRRTFGSEGLGPRWIPALVVAAVIPLIVFVLVNEVRFGTSVTVPFNRQVYALFNKPRQATLRANGGSLFGLEFVPTGLLQYLRPDAIRLSSLVPWVSFPRSVSVVGHVSLATPAPTSSVPASMPLAALLALVGTVAFVGRRWADRLATLRAPVVGAVAGVGITLTAAYVANRYLADFVPLLALLALPGACITAGWIERRRNGARAVAIGGVALLVVAGLWATLGLGIVQQNLVSPSLDEATQARFVRLQYRVHRHLPGGEPPDVVRRSHLGPPAARGTVVVLGNCDGVYWSSGTAWRAVARTPASGRFEVKFRWTPTVGLPVALVASGSATRGNVVGAQAAPDGRVRFGLQPTGRTPLWIWSPYRRFDPTRLHDAVIVIDPNNLKLQIVIDGATVLNRDWFNTLVGAPLEGAIAPVAPARIGGVPWAPAPAAPFPGTLREVLADRSVCRNAFGGRTTR